jgi:hypothetical protein
MVWKDFLTVHQILWFCVRWVSTQLHLYTLLWCLVLTRLYLVEFYEDDKCTFPFALSSQNEEIAYGKLHFMGEKCTFHHYEQKSCFLRVNTWKVILLVTMHMGEEKAWHPPVKCRLFDSKSTGWHAACKPHGNPILLVHLYGKDFLGETGTYVECTR